MKKALLISGILNLVVTIVIIWCSVFRILDHTSLLELLSAAVAHASMSVILFFIYNEF